jgi:hypothetical protein
MEQAMFNVGDVVADAEGGRAIVVGNVPDRNGMIVVRIPSRVEGPPEYRFMYEAAFTLAPPAPKRYVVEVRPPVKGERYVSHRGQVFTDRGAFDNKGDRCVIVEELS